MTSLKINTQFIKLDQALKFANAAESGAFAKQVVREGLVTVNGKTELHRGRKLYPGDKFSFGGESFEISAS